MIQKKWYAFLFAAVLIITILLSSAVLPVSAAGGPSLQTTLQDNVIQKGSKKTFDVWARNGSGKKIKATVKFNGQRLSPTWDDDEKASYTLLFTKEGENIVEVSASSDGGQKKELTYHITYQKAKQGEAIGKAVWSVETFTLGCGYLIYPTEVDIYEGETAADQLIRLLHENGFVAYYSGSTQSSFYLAYIADGMAASNSYSGYKKSGTAAFPQKLDVSPSIPSLLVPHLEQSMTYFEPEDYEKNWKGYLGEFAITNGSGWMYCVNNVFPNVGFSDTFLSDGDVVRVQFTLGYGADIGGAAAVGGKTETGESMPSGFYSVADKDALTVAIAQARASGLLTKANMKKAYTAALQSVMTLNASQGTVDAAATALNAAFNNPGAETNTPPTEPVSPPSSDYGGENPSTQPSSRPTSGNGGESGSTGSSTENQGSPAPDGQSVSTAATESGGTASQDSGGSTTGTKGSKTTSSLSGTSAIDENAPAGTVSDGSGTSGGSGWLVWLIASLIVLVLAGGGTAFVLFYHKKSMATSEADRADHDGDK